MIILNALEGVLVLFLLALIGYWLAWRKWFSITDAALLPRVIVNVALPPYLLYIMVKSFTRADLLEALSGCALPLTSMSLAWGFAYLLCALCKVKKSRRGVLCAAASTSNTVFIGIPVNISIFGDQAMPYVLVYFVCNNIFFWTIGNYSLAKAGEGQDVPLFSRDTLKQIFSPPLMATSLAIIVIMLGLPVPHFILVASKYLGGLPTPLAMLFIGMMFYHMKFSSIKITKDLLIIFFGRFVLSPLLVVGLAYFFPVNKMMFEVFITQSSLPVMTNIAILAGLYKSDPEFATMGVLTTTMLSLITIPLIVTFISYL